MRVHKTKSYSHINNLNSEILPSKRKSIFIINEWSINSIFMKIQLLRVSRFIYKKYDIANDEFLKAVFPLPSFR